ncbi:hypothetical protein ECCB7326_0301, partial [Escherichia coli CB7326]
MFRLMIGS